MTTGKIEPGMNTLFDNKGRYILNDFQQKQPFSSFLPGIAGEYGVPMWVFYVNRGQAITSFGIQSKDQAMLEFQPANKAYWMTPHIGFRTFIKQIVDGQTILVQPFAPWESEPAISRTMLVEMNALTLEETNRKAGLRTRIQYFAIPGESFAALARTLTIENISNHAFSLECLDGLPVVIPFGASDGALKMVGRTIEAWMQVYNLENNVPFYRMRAGTEDRADVAVIQAGHFAFAYDGRDGNIVPALVDPYLVFRQNNSFQSPDGFVRRSLKDLSSSHQNTGGQTPCAFFGVSAALAPGERLTLHELYGHTDDVNSLDDITKKYATSQRLQAKLVEARQLAQKITQPIETHSSDPIFDQYCRQTFLDNVLRGGQPVQLAESRHVFHIYGRKHGDPERDYNDFSLKQEPFSQGNANYRDVNQNRRSDVLFYPQIGAANIHTFMDLIQLDGYNPLILQGSQFTLDEQVQQALGVEFSQFSSLLNFIRNPFTPGSLEHFLNQQATPYPLDAVRAAIWAQAKQHHLAEHGEGYWIDHWTYNLDQIEAYLAVYPDRLEELIFQDRSYSFFESAYFVQPREKKYVLLDGKPRQLNAVRKDTQKARLLEKRGQVDHWVRKQYDQGEVYQTTLFDKLFLLALIKLSTLDPLGMGIEMEANRPGWYDALNGLPGLFGSGMSETYELKRLFLFLQTLTDQYPQQTLHLPCEAANLLSAVQSALEIYPTQPDSTRDHDFWEAISTAREAYRARVYVGNSGEEHIYTCADLQPHLVAFLQKLEQGIEKACILQGGLPPTYFTYHPVEFERLPESADSEGSSYINVSRFKVQPMPLFLEGMARYLKIAGDIPASEMIYQQVKASALYDQKLGMYKVNASLAEQPQDIGRARAFTPGWLENESIWLHMEYKYLLAILDAGLTQPFLTEFKRVLVPFMDAKQYGRSPLENSSFIVSSAHPEERLHGAGFVARLSGSTAEFLSIWQHMLLGKQPFYMHHNQLNFIVDPVVPGWLFTEEGTLQFKLLGFCQVTYHHHGPQDLTTENFVIRSWRLVDLNGGEYTVLMSSLPQPWAEKIRNAEIASLDVYFEIRKKVN
ncbi:MAG: cellobiose phosphorylase [Chloroflexi bacterium HGW-Chloroflexi-10]|nr:MAG: cellobiose phosphorylase [Chloroflexi bacterium HGW-Chloroflexi-10]